MDDFILKQIDEIEEIFENIADSNEWCPSVSSQFLLLHMNIRSATKT